MQEKCKCGHGEFNHYNDVLTQSRGSCVACPCFRFDQIAKDNNCTSCQHPESEHTFSNKGCMNRGSTSRLCQCTKYIPGEISGIKISNYKPSTKVATVSVGSEEQMLIETAADQLGLNARQSKNDNWYCTKDIIGVRGKLTLVIMQNKSAKSREKNFRVTWTTLKKDKRVELIDSFAEVQGLIHILQEGMNAREKSKA